jgi:hypothetical protein
VNFLLANRAVRIRHLLHHALAREQACKRRATIAPILPGIVRPILIVGALSSGRVEPEGLE